MDEQKRDKEIEKRERLVQTFLLTGGFFVANAKEEARLAIVLIFTVYIIITILYYVLISRTRGTHITVDLFAFVSSTLYSFLMLIFMYTQVPNAYNNLDFLILFFSLTGVITYALLSPEGIEYITNLSEKVSDKLSDKLANAKVVQKIAKIFKSA